MTAGHILYCVLMGVLVLVIILCSISFGVVEPLKRHWEEQAKNEEKR